MAAPDWQAALAEREAEEAADNLPTMLRDTLAAGCPPAPPPFMTGDRILFRAHPADGIYRVTRCSASPKGWRLDFEALPIHGLSRMYGCCNAADVVAVPDDWEPPPVRPLTPLEKLQLASDGEITATQWRTAAAEDESPEHQARMRAYYRARAEWHRRHVVPLLGR